MKSRNANIKKLTHHLCSNSNLAKIEDELVLLRESHSKIEIASNAASIRPYLNRLNETVNFIHATLNFAASQGVFFPYKLLDNITRVKIELRELDSSNRKKENELNTIELLCINQPNYSPKKGTTVTRPSQTAAANLVFRTELRKCDKTHDELLAIKTKAAMKLYKNNLLFDVINRQKLELDKPELNQYTESAYIPKLLSAKNKKELLETLNNFYNNWYYKHIIQLKNIETTLDLLDHICALTLSLQLKGKLIKNTALCEGEKYVKIIQNDETIIRIRDAIKLAENIKIQYKRQLEKFPSVEGSQNNEEAKNFHQRKRSNSVSSQDTILATSEFCISHTIANNILATSEQRTVSRHIRQRALINISYSTPLFQSHNQEHKNKSFLLAENSKKIPTKL